MPTTPRAPARPMPRKAVGAAAAPSEPVVVESSEPPEVPVESLVAAELGPEAVRLVSWVLELPAADVLLPPPMTVPF